MTSRSFLSMDDSPREQARRYFEYLALWEEDLPLPTTAAAQETGGVNSVPVSAAPLPGCLEPLPGSLDEFRKQVSNCGNCPLGKDRTRIVFGDGSASARIVFVGEAPGFEEDKQGIPFVGRAGQLLNKLLADVGLKRTDVYICNVLKCRPPNNRDPLPEEVATCRPYLMTQLSLIQPSIVVCLGRHAAAAILGSNLAMKDLRGRTFPWEGMQVMVMYHPAYFLRNLNNLYLGEEDFKLLRRLYDELPPR